MNKIYMCIDLKSFYASVECRERGLDPLDTNLVVADESRTDKTICLAVSPSLKSYGLSGRCRLFEAKQKVKEVNYQRRKNNNYKPFIGKSYIASELNNNKSLELDFIKAVPRMKLYMKYSTEIYNVYFFFFIIYRSFNGVNFIIIIFYLMKIFNVYAFYYIFYSKY